MIEGGVDWLRIRSELREGVESLFAAGVRPDDLARAVSHAAQGEELPPPFGSPGQSRTTLYLLAWMCLVVAPSHYGLARVTLPMRIDAVAGGEATWGRVFEDLAGCQGVSERPQGPAAAEVSALMARHVEILSDPRAHPCDRLETALSDALLTIQARASLARALIEELGALLAEQWALGAAPGASPPAPDPLPELDALLDELSTHAAAGGDRAAAAERLRAAERATEEICARAPRAPGAWVNHATVRLLAGDFVEAERDLSHALELEPAHTVARAKRAVTRYLAARPVDALVDVVSAFRDGTDAELGEQLSGVREAALEALRGAGAAERVLAEKVEALLAEGDLDAAAVVLTSWDGARS